MHGPGGEGRRADEDVKVHNVDVVLRVMSERLFKIDLSHIDSRRVVRGAREDNKNIIELLYLYAQRRTAGASMRTKLPVHGSVVPAAMRAGHFAR